MKALILDAISVEKAMMRQFGWIIPAALVVLVAAVAAAVVLRRRKQRKEGNKDADTAA